MGNFSKFCAQPENLAIVVAFDPGETTGWCAMGIHPDDVRWPRGKPPHEQLRLCEYGQIDCTQQGGDDWANTVRKHPGLNLAGENAGVERMLNLLDVWPSAVIVFEDFILDFKKADQARHTLSPVRITSAFCYGRHARGWGTEQMYVQNRSMAKTTCTDLRLKNWGLYDTHSGPHARDAVRHAYYFLRTCCEDGIEGETNRHFAWPHLFSDPVARQVSAAKKAARPKGERVKGLG